MNKTYHPAIRNGKPVLVSKTEKIDKSRIMDEDYFEARLSELKGYQIVEVSPELLEAMPEWWYEEQGFEYDIPITVLRPEGHTGKETLVEGVDFKTIPTAVFIEGHYSNTCISCQNLFSDTDKKWLICKNCCEKPIAVPLSSVTEAAPVEDDSDVWDEAFTEAPLRIHPKSEEWLKQRYHITRR